MLGFKYCFFIVKTTNFINAKIKVSKVRLRQTLLDIRVMVFVTFGGCDFNNYVEQYLFF